MSSSSSSLGILYAAGRWTSFSPCSLGLLPITVSYISTATNDSDDGNTIAPTLAFAAGLAMVFTALGVSTSALGGVFGGVVVGDGGGGDRARRPYRRSRPWSASSWDCSSWS
ncbi:hypothetical protein ACHAW5_004214 [Stephanodiscus triporus]|uniref:Cytochrome C biogenesis protein transmembrane domain-containing protein n=1 Tax=Stephanodiscus triporus TaxID=2934178 RepID=A0ABD3PSF3_9STRA